MASACDPWLRYVAFGTSPPVYPTRVLTTPGNLRIRSCMPQKQPPASTARSRVPVDICPLSLGYGEVLSAVDLAAIADTAVRRSADSPSTRSLWCGFGVGPVSARRSRQLPD